MAWLLNLIAARSTVSFKRKGADLDAEGSGLWGVIVSAVLIWIHIRGETRRPKKRGPPERL